MPEIAPVGRVLMILGVVLLVAGALVSLLGRGFRLPGDVLIRRDTYTIYVPIATSIVLSLVLTLLLSLVIRR